MLDLTEGVLSEFADSAGRWRDAAERELRGAYPLRVGRGERAKRPNEWREAQRQRGLEILKAIKRRRIAQRRGVQQHETGKFIGR